MSRTTDCLLGALEVLARLGAGGMAEVHRARQEWLKHDVAIHVAMLA